MAFFKNYLFNLLPAYFHRADSNKDSNNEGTLERFLQVLGNDIDTEVITYLDSFTDILDIETTPSKFINYLSYTLGNPPDIFKDEVLYKRLLRYILSVYKIKGTRESYELYFSMLGFNITIIEDNDSTADLYDDSTEAYDNIVTLYDDGCKPCSPYDILFTSVADPLSPLNSTTLQNLRDIIFFVEPINAHLRNLSLGIDIEDNVNFCMEQHIKMETLTFLRYDVPALGYDTVGITYDSSTPQTVLNLPVDCTASTPLEGISVWTIPTDFQVQ